MRRCADVSAVRRKDVFLAKDAVKIGGNGCQKSVLFGFDRHFWGRLLVFCGNMAV